MSMLKGIVYFVMDILETVVFVGSMFIVVYLYLVQPNQIKGESMANTFQDRDYIFTSKLTYRLRKPERGDVVVFDAPRAPGQDYTVEYIKRLIGLPGDTISFTHCTDSASQEKVDCDVEVNGKTLDEPYIRAKTKLFYNSKYHENELIRVPEDHMFFMGDNRTGSLDSRFLGPLPTSEIVGVVFFRYLPFSSFGRITNPLHPR